MEEEGLLSLPVFYNKQLWCYTDSLQQELLAQTLKVETRPASWEILQVQAWLLLNTISISKFHLVAVSVWPRILSRISGNHWPMLTDRMKLKVVPFNEKRVKSHKRDQNHKFDLSGTICCVIHALVT